MDPISPSSPPSLSFALFFLSFLSSLIASFSAFRSSSLRPLSSKISVFHAFTPITAASGLRLCTSKNSCRSAGLNSPSGICSANSVAHFLILPPSKSGSEYITGGLMYIRSKSSLACTRLAFLNATRTLIRPARTSASSRSSGLLVVMIRICPSGLATPSIAFSKPESVTRPVSSPDASARAPSFSASSFSCLS